MSREKKKDCMNCLHYDMMEGKKIIQRMFILHRLRKENNMRKNIQVKVKVPQFTVITGLDVCPTGQLVRTHDAGS